MNDPDTLTVWIGNYLVGELKRISYRQFDFRYSQNWIKQSGYAISQTLPLRDEIFSGEDNVAQRFFGNLLPEGAVRNRIIRDHKIPDADFDLLRAIGGECAGALSILQNDQQPNGNLHYYQLTQEEIAELITYRRVAKNWSTHEYPRLSLAGAQDKCPILIDNGKFLLPLKQSPSSHILKFEVPDYPHLPAYEAFVTQLGKSVELPVVDIRLHFKQDKYFIVVLRYDRIIDKKNKIQRLHQEDFCQAMGYSHAFKYEQYGGPAFGRCCELVRDVSSEPALDLELLLRWQIFNVLAGNSDGHAKNLSLLYFEDGQIRLAPFYDLICTRAIEQIDHKLAFSVGGQRNPEQITRKNWLNMAKQCGVRPQFLLGLVKDLSSKLQKNLKKTKVDFESQFGEYPALQRVEYVTKKQCRKMRGI